VFKWTPSKRLEDLGTLEFDHPTWATGISANGDVIVGTSRYQKDTNGGTDNVATRWTAAEGFRRLTIEHPGSGAKAVSADGSVIIGAFTDTMGESHVFRWTATSGMVPLSLGTLFIPSVVALNQDGSIIVGNSAAQEGGAWIWNKSHGLRLLRDVLFEHGADLTEWSKIEVKAISADGTVLAGTGFYSDKGGAQSWIARLGTN
jgi:probable HAF family extracellular repeat protein